jgi:hypothetical protein
MMRMGPEALLVLQRTSPRSGMAEYARLEYPRAERLSVDATIERELAYLPVKRSATQRLIRWAREWFRHDEAPPLPVLAAVRPKTFEVARERDAPGRPSSGAVLAAVPALRAGSRAEGEPHSISALPVLGRA